MRNVMLWVRSNLLTVISVAVAAASLVVMALISWGWGGQFRQELQKRTTLISQARGYMSRTEEIPAEQPDAPPESIQLTINPVAIQQLEKLYQRMDQEFQGVRDTAVQFNQHNHVPLLEQLFPEPASNDLPYNARVLYRSAFQKMLGKPGSDPILPGLDAGMPPTLQELDTTLGQLEAEIRNLMQTPGSNTALTPEDEQKIRQDLRLRLLNLLKERAEQIHLYAVTDINSPDFPFTLGAWSTQDNPPMHQVWEGQLELWIQQDIAQAIAMTNQTDNPSVSVLTAPVKRLIKVEVLPGYVGLHTLGGAVMDFQSSRGGRSMVSSRGGVAPGAYPPPLGGKTGTHDELAPANFYVGPTGRVSNAVYDVRHVRLVAVVDYQGLPQLIENLGRTNFMTVLRCDIEDEDEYLALQEGFLYTSGDAVRVDMVIETLWLRDWTEPLMPKAVRQYVGLDDPPANLEKTGPGDMMYPYPPGMEGLYY
ncbi:MAG TPA: hypothetical protein VF184_06940 [Phycisphaeraceae bacterium]